MLKFMTLSSLLLVIFVHLVRLHRRDSSRLSNPNSHGAHAVVVVVIFVKYCMPADKTPLICMSPCSCCLSYHLRWLSNFIVPDLGNLSNPIPRCLCCCSCCRRRDLRKLSNVIASAGRSHQVHGPLFHKKKILHGSNVVKNAIIPRSLPILRSLPIFIRANAR
jgi:hypothetical protein